MRKVELKLEILNHCDTLRKIILYTLEYIYCFMDVRVVNFFQFSCTDVKGNIKRCYTVFFILWLLSCLICIFFL